MGASLCNTMAILFPSGNQTWWFFKSTSYKFDDFRHKQHKSHQTSIYSSYSVVQWISQRPLLNLWWTPVAPPCVAEVQATTTWMCRWRHPNDAARQETRRTGHRRHGAWPWTTLQIQQICRTFRFTIQPIHSIYNMFRCSDVPWFSLESIHWYCKFPGVEGTICRIHLQMGEFELCFSIFTLW